MVCDAHLRRHRLCPSNMVVLGRNERKLLLEPSSNTSGNFSSKTLGICRCELTPNAQQLGEQAMKFGCRRIKQHILLSNGLRIRYRSDQKAHDIPAYCIEVGMCHDHQVMPVNVPDRAYQSCSNTDILHIAIIIKPSMTVAGFCSPWHI